MEWLAERMDEWLAWLDYDVFCGLNDCRRQIVNVVIVYTVPAYIKPYLDCQFVRPSVHRSVSALVSVYVCT